MKNIFTFNLRNVLNHVRHRLAVKQVTPRDKPQLQFDRDYYLNTDEGRQVLKNFIRGNELLSCATSRIYRCYKILTEATDLLAESMVLCLDLTPEELAKLDEDTARMHGAIKEYWNMARALTREKSFLVLKNMLNEQKE